MPNNRSLFAKLRRRNIDTPLIRPKFGCMVLRDHETSVYRDHPMEEIPTRPLTPTYPEIQIGLLAISIYTTTRLS
jgi:hypothetical protein